MQPEFDITWVGNATTLDAPSCALVEQMRAVAIERCSAAHGNVVAVVSHQILDVLAMITGMP